MRVQEDILSFRLQVMVEGKNIKTYNIYVQKGSTVDHLKFSIEKMYWVPVSHQELLYKGKKLEDGRYLSEYDIQDHDTINFVNLYHQARTKEELDQQVEIKQKESSSFNLQLGAGLFTFSLPLAVGLGVASYYIDPVFVPGVLVGVAGCTVAAIIGAIMVTHGWQQQK
jgi:ubiquitin domain-containing protein